MKDKRIKMLAECMAKIKEVQDYYIGAYTGWILLQAAKQHIMALHHLEDETNFSEEELGVKMDGIIPNVVMQEKT